MKTRIKVLLVSIVVIGISYNVVWFVVVYFAKRHAKNLYHEVQSHERVYVYESFSRALNNVIYIDDLKDSNAIINFYDCDAKGIDTTVGVDVFSTMPLTTVEPLYVLKDCGPGSRMVEVISFDTSCWGYIKGYVYKATTHTHPPPDSLIKKENEFMKRPNPYNKNTVHKHANPYGFYCKACYD